MRNIILSIKPVFSDQIYQGNKIVELRKKIGKEFQPGQKIYIYTSSPVKSLTGTAQIRKVEQVPVSKIRSHYLDNAGISAPELDAYYDGKTHGYLIWLKNVMRFKASIPLSELKTIGFTAPQSFGYATSAFLKLLDDHSIEQ